MPSKDKASPGQKFTNPSAATWNSMVDAGDAYRMSELDRKGIGRQGSRKTDVIKVKNVSGAARARGEVLGAFGKSVTNLEPGNIRLTGTAPTAGKHFGILLKTLPNNEYGELQLAGACIATVDVSDEAHEYADIEDGEHTLVSADSGPVSLLWKPVGTGELECFVRIGGGGTGGDSSPLIHAMTPVDGVPARDEFQMGSAECGLMQSDASGLLSGTEETITLYNPTLSDVQGERYVSAIRDASGLPIIILEDCYSEGEEDI